MDNYKIKVKDEAESKSKVREYLVEDVETGEYFLTANNSSFVGAIEVPEGADCFMQWPTGHKVFYRDNFAESWNSAYREWQFVRGDDGIDQSNTLWKRADQDPALISGADALRALADGKEVELLDEELDIPWTKIMTEKDERNAIEPCISMFFDGYREIKFRLKPQTIKLELEVPKPFEPKVGDEYFCINDSEVLGWTRYVCDEVVNPQDFNFGVWRTQAEIKQVVEQLRKIRGAS